MTPEPAVNIPDGEQRYRMLFDQGLDGIAIIDKHGKLVDVNPAFAAMHGYLASEMKGMSLHDLDSLESAKSIPERMRYVMSGHVSHFDVEHRHKDGHIFPLEVTTSMIEIGGTQYLLALERDITERKRLDNALKDNEAKYRRLVELTPNGLLIHIDGTIIFANASAARLAGLAMPEELVGRKLFDFVHPDYRGIVAERVRRMTQDKEDMPLIEEKFIRVDGTVFDAEVGAIPFRLNEQDAVQVVFRDITERKQAEAALMESDTKLRAIFDNVRDAIGISKNGVHVFANPAYLSLFGWENLEQFLGASILDSIAPGQREEVMKNVRRRAAGETVPVFYETRGMRRDGSEFDMEVNVSTYELEGEKFTLGTMRDITERKRAEKALAVSSRHWQSTFNSIANPLFLVDNQNVIYEVNTSAASFLGKSREELLGRRCWEVVHGTPFPLEGCPVLKMRESLKRESLNAWMGEKCCDIIVDPLFDADGGLFGAIHIINDITERMQAEDALRESEEKFRHLFEHATLGTSMTYFTGEIHVNKALCDLLGYSREDLVNRNWQEITHPDDIAMTQTYIDDLMSGKQGSVRFVKRFLHKNGTVVLAELVSSCQRDHQGKPLYLLTTVIDITERLKNEAALNRLEQAVQSSGEIILMGGLDGIITFINKAFSDTYGYEPEEVVGKQTPRILDSGEERDEDHGEFWKTLLEKKTFTREYLNKAKDGHLVPMEIAANPIINTQGDVIGFLAIQRDITERKCAKEKFEKLQQELFQAQKLESVGTLAAGIAHDFNNILGIILGYSDMMKLGGADPAIIKNATGVIAEAVERGAGLVRQILTFARQTDALMGPLSLNILIKEIAKMFGETFPKTIVVDVDVDQNLPLILADAAQMHQLLLNLSVNARDAMPDGGRLTIGTEVVDGKNIGDPFLAATGQPYVHLWISDTGTGMSPEVVSHMFEPFFTTKPKGKGTGLGLSVAYGVVTKHQGQIRIESVPGAGTTFHIYLPAYNDTPGKRNWEEDSKGAAAGGHETILVVEDELNISDLLVAMLRSKGYRPIYAKDGKEAMKLYGEHADTVDIVLSDVGLPEASGIDVFTYVRSIHPDAKVIMASGYFEPEQEAKLLDAGVSAIIQKPYKPSEVFKTIRDVLDGTYKTEN